MDMDLNSGREEVFRKAKFLLSPVDQEWLRRHIDTVENLVDEFYNTGDADELTFVDIHHYGREPESEKELLYSRVSSIFKEISSSRFKDVEIFSLDAKLKAVRGELGEIKAEQECLADKLSALSDRAIENILDICGQDIFFGVYAPSLNGRLSGFFFEKGRDFFAVANRYAEQGREQGDGYSSYFLGLSYEYGIGREQDISRAFSMYDAAAKQDVKEAVVKMAMRESSWRIR